MFHIKNPALLTAALAAGFAATTAHAAPIFDEDFEGVGDGNQITTGNTDFTSVVGGDELIGRTDTSNLLLNGTSNTIAEFDDPNSTTRTLEYNVPGSGDFTDSYTIRFGFQEPSAANGGRTGGNIVLRSGVDGLSSTSGDVGPQVQFSDGALTLGGASSQTGTYSTDTPYIFDVVVNTNNSTAITYTDGNGLTETLAGDRYDVFSFNKLTGVSTQLIDDATFRNDGGGDDAINRTHDAFFFTSFGGSSVNLINLDNVQVFDEATVTAVPEPASLVLLGLGGLMLLPRRNRA